MPTLRMREEIEQARRLLTNHLSDPAVQRRQEQRLVTWNESAEEFLETAGLVCIGSVVPVLGTAFILDDPAQRMTDALPVSCTRIHTARAFLGLANRRSVVCRTARDRSAAGG